MTKTILILGASYCGLTVAHSLLKKTFTAVKDYKVVLVSPTTDFYYNTASVRAIVPGQMADDKLFLAIAPGFKKYGKSFEFIQGAASALDPAAKSVPITTAGAEQTLTYDILVITTGTNGTGTIPWKSQLDGSESTKASLHKVQEQVKSAKSIAIGGGGPTGVEAAGELGFEYKGKKEITLITSGDELLVGSMPANIAKGAEAGIAKLGVKVIKNTKITSTTVLESGQTELTLSTGSTLTVDLYLPTTGVVVNSSFIPATLLNSKGEVSVDDFLKVKNTTDIWAAGDISDLEPSQLVYAEKQGAALAKNLDLVLRGSQPVAYKSGGGRIMGLTLGRSKATGMSGTSKIPGFIIWWLKGRTMGTENLTKYVDGSKF